MSQVRAGQIGLAEVVQRTVQQRIRQPIMMFYAERVTQRSRKDEGKLTGTVDTGGAVAVEDASQVEVDVEGTVADEVEGAVESADKIEGDVQGDVEGAGAVALAGEVAVEGTNEVEVEAIAESSLAGQVTILSQTSAGPKVVSDIDSVNQQVSDENGSHERTLADCEPHHWIGHRDGCRSGDMAILTS